MLGRVIVRNYMFLTTLSLLFINVKSVISLVNLKIKRAWPHFGVRLPCFGDLDFNQIAAFVKKYY